MKTIIACYLLRIVLKKGFFFFNKDVITENISNSSVNETVNQKQIELNRQFILDYNN